MKVRSVLLGLLAGLLAVGCGGGGTTQFGEVSGVIYDANGNVVRGARVYVEQPTNIETVSNSSGAFVLSNVPEGDVYVQAETRVGGIRYMGQNVARVFGNERSKSINVGVYRDSQLAGIQGYVNDRFGNALQGARVFAASANGLSSAVAITDDEGYYIIGRLQAGVQYALNAGGRGYNADEDTVTLNADELLDFDFVLSEGTDPFLPAPQNLFAIAWTTPFEATDTRVAGGGVKENISRQIDGKRYAKIKKQVRQPKFSAGGNNIEVDLGWDAVNSSALLGYGIYRGRTSTGALTAIDFLRDPYAVFFQDLDDNLQENLNYYYEVTALNTQYPDTNNSESNPSNRYGVFTLGDMTLRSVTQTPGVRFRWNTAAGAATYAIFLFDRYPSLGVDSIWDTFANTTTGTEQTYNGPTLQSGRTYYYLVLGLANNDDSRTLSEVGTFVKN